MSEFDPTADEFAEPVPSDPVPLSEEESQRLEGSLEEVSVPPEPHADRGAGFMMFEGRLLPVVQDCSWDEETYVQHELAITKAQMDAGRLKEVVDSRPGPTFGETRMQRSERYLRWRYAGFRTGQVAGL